MMTAKERFDSNDFLRILCVGDIQTAQPFSKPSWMDWMARTLQETGDLQIAWRRQVTSSAVSRATPKHVATYYRHYVEQYRPDIVLLSFGVTPMYPTYNEKQFAAELDGLLLRLEKQSVTTVLWSPYPLLAGLQREVSLSLNSLYKQKAVERGIQFIDLYHEFDEIELSKLFTYKVGVKNDLFGLSVDDLDPITLNGTGQYIIAKKMVYDLFRISLPQSDYGSFVTPTLESVKKWA